MPGYATIGLGAPARLLQGISVNGEYGTSAIVKAKLFPTHSRALGVG
ncbi:hypothetical protein [Hymenobacter sp. UV11]|nr:hypothetical protein [Hymenobacter sp. UV11]